LRFTWDPKKAAANFADHGITFPDAVSIFRGRTIEEIDDRFDYGEERVQAIGLLQEKEIVVVYTDVASGERRIISARPATARERARYWREADG
jgi:uncharacterized DUF497 family protein